MIVVSATSRRAAFASKASASAYARSATSREHHVASACEADRNRSQSSRCLTGPTPSTPASARTARRSSGERDGVVSPFTRLFHHEEPRPPLAHQRIQPRARGGADCEHAKRVGSVDRRGLIIAEQVHLREGNAMWLAGQLLGVRRDLVSKLIVLGLPVDGIDG